MSFCTLLCSYVNYANILNFYYRFEKWLMGQFMMARTSKNPGDFHVDLGMTRLKNLIVLWLIDAHAHLTANPDLVKAAWALM